MPQANEIDGLKQLVLRNHLDKIAKLPPPAAPTGQFVLDRGYLGEEQQDTELGNEYLTLLDAGLMDKNGQVTEEGKLYAMTAKESLYAPFQDFAKREKLGLNAIDEEAEAEGQPSALESVGGMVKDFFVKSIPKTWGALYNISDENKQEKSVNELASMAKGALLSLEPLGTGAYYKGADAALALTGLEDDERDTAALMLKQEYKRTRLENDGIKGVDLLMTIAQSSAPLAIREKAEIQAGGAAQLAEDEAAMELSGSMLLDPTMLASFGATTAMKGVGGVMTRATLNAEKMALKATVLQTEKLGVKAQRAVLDSALSKAENTAAKVAERSEALKSIGKTDEALRYDATKVKIGDKMSALKTQADDLAAHEARLDADIAGLAAKEGVSNALLQISNKAKLFNAIPANVVGSTLETAGRNLMKADAWLDDLTTRTGMSGLYSAIKGVPGMSAGLVLGPAAATGAVAARVLASGPLMESIGRFTKILGRELVQERGSVPYWRRVANNPTLSTAQKFLSHRMDELTLGGRATNVTSQVAKGTAVSYPLNLGIEFMQDPYAKPEDILDRSAAASFVFGGGSAGAGAMFRGNAAALKQTRINDQLNFVRNMTESQKSGYQALSSGAKRNVATYAAAFPNLNFEFADGMSSRYDPVTNTVFVNPASNNPLRPLIAHEVMHYATIRNQITPVIHSMLLGDAETPGLLRKTNGELDPNFANFKDAYDKRTDAAKIERRKLEDIAEEYFIESTVDHLVGMAESGELGRMAGKTQAGRQLAKFVETTMPRLPILKDFFFRSGGAMGAGGRFVQGNGLLAEGIKDLPEAKAIMRNLMQEMAGEAGSSRTTKRLSKDEKSNLPVQKGDPIVDSFHAIFETDKNGKPILDKDGNHIALSRATDEARQSAGLVVIEEQVRRVNEGHMPEAGEIKIGDSQTWFGKFIHPKVISALAAKGILNNKQIAILRNINTATKLGKGSRYTVINHPATIRGRGGRVRYASLEATMREAVPVGFSVTKQGNILVHLMSVDQLHKNIISRAASKRGQTLYQGNTEAIKQDISAMMELHASNTKTDKYYQDKYGARWQEHQQFINTIFGQMTKAQGDLNPMFNADKIKGDGVYRTYRLDRISKATRMDGAEMPFDYEKVKVNYLPDGVLEPAE